MWSAASLECLVGGGGGGDVGLVGAEVDSLGVLLFSGLRLDSFLEILREENRNMIVEGMRGEREKGWEWDQSSYKYIIASVHDPASHTSYHTYIQTPPYIHVHVLCALSTSRECAQNGNHRFITFTSIACSTPHLTLGYRFRIPLQPAASSARHLSLLSGLIGAVNPGHSHDSTQLLSNNGCKRGKRCNRSCETKIKRLSYLQSTP